MNRITASVFLILICQLGLSMQECAECTCCKGSNTCDSNKSCITGCIDGYYGDKCTDECLENCKTCENGFDCIECKPGYYTNKCNLPCGKGCINNTCQILSGECQCKSTDFVKGKCNYCLGLKYGDDCNNTCPTNCGTCTSDTQCSWCTSSIYYGSHCQYKCASGCDGGRCSKGTGNCMSGCRYGFTGEKCDTCSSVFYGKYCDSNCSDNCAACFSANNCTECKVGFYGEACTNTCPLGCKANFKNNENTRICTIDTGSCLQGCKSTSSYGEYCEKQCNDTCINKTCDWKTGYCLEGCAMNYYGSFCEKECALSCLSKTGKSICDDIKGHCAFGCKNGFHGNKCDKLCSTQCENTTCHQITAECVFGCINGFEGQKCLKVISSEEVGFTVGTLIGSTIGAFVAGCIVVGVTALVVFIVWRRRNGIINDYETSTLEYENTLAPCENRTQGNALDTGFSVTYEDLKSHDERLYTQITTYQQI